MASPGVTGHGDKRSRLQEKVIAALLISPNIYKAAKLAGVSDQTICNWCKIPDFLEAYEAARKDFLDRTIVRMQHDYFEVADELKKDLHSSDPAVKHRAAQLLIDSMLKGVELSALANKIKNNEPIPEK